MKKKFVKCPRTPFESSPELKITYDEPYVVRTPRNCYGEHVTAAPYEVINYHTLHLIKNWFSTFDYDEAKNYAKACNDKFKADMSIAMYI